MFEYKPTDTRRMMQLKAAASTAAILAVILPAAAVLGAGIGIIGINSYQGNEFTPAWKEIPPLVEQTHDVLPNRHPLYMTEGTRKLFDPKLVKWLENRHDNRTRIVVATLSDVTPDSDGHRPIDTVLKQIAPDAHIGSLPLEQLVQNNKKDAAGFEQRDAYQTIGLSEQQRFDLIFIEGQNPDRTLTHEMGHAQRAVSPSDVRPPAVTFFWGTYRPAQNGYIYDTLVDKFIEEARADQMVVEATRAGVLPLAALTTYKTDRAHNLATGRFADHASFAFMERANLPTTAEARAYLEVDRVIADTLGEKFEASDTPSTEYKRTEPDAIMALTELAEDKKLSPDVRDAVKATLEHLAPIKDGKICNRVSEAFKQRCYATFQIEIPRNLPTVAEHTALGSGFIEYGFTG